MVWKAWCRSMRQVVILHMQSKSRAADRKSRPAVGTSRPAPSEPLPLARLHLLNVLQPSKTARPTRDQVFKHVNLCEASHIKTTGTAFTGLSRGIKWVAGWGTHVPEPVPYKAFYNQIAGLVRVLLPRSLRFWPSSVIRHDAP